MTGRNWEVSPPRFLDGTDKVAEHLRAYEEVSAPRVESFERFVLGQAERTRRRVGLGAWLGLGVAAGSLALILIMTRVSSDPIAPESFAVAQKRPSAVDSSQPVLPTAPSPLESGRTADAGLGRTTTDPSVRAEAESQVASQPTAPAKRAPSSGDSQRTKLGVATAVPRSPETSLLDECKRLHNDKDYAAAATCYGRLASESGSELAWLEKARLEGRALGRPDQALKTLARYRSQFPHGALAHEAEVAEEQYAAAVRLRSSGEAVGPGTQR